MRAALVESVIFGFELLEGEVIEFDGESIKPFGGVGVLKYLMWFVDGMKIGVGLEDEDVAGWFFGGFEDDFIGFDGDM